MSYDRFKLNEKHKFSILVKIIFPRYNNHELKLVYYEVGHGKVLSLSCPFKIQISRLNIC